MRRSHGVVSLGGLRRRTPTGPAPPPKRPRIKPQPIELLPTKPPLTRPLRTKQRQTSVTADKIVFVLEQTTMSGSVTFVVNGITLRADETVYTKGTRTLTLKGNVTATLPEGVAVAAK